MNNMDANVGPSSQLDLISRLPIELALTVFSYLDAKDLVKAAQTCRYWNSLADDSILWKDECRRKGVNPLNEIRHSERQWKNRYMLGLSWMSKPVNSYISITSVEHEFVINYFNGSLIVTGDNMGVHKLWSVTTGECIKTLVGAPIIVKCYHIVDDLLISGDVKGSMTIWNISDGRLLKILNGHKNVVKCMVHFQNRLVSGSSDKTMCVWSIPDWRCLRVLTGHTMTVQTVEYNDNYIVSASLGSELKVWDANTGVCLRTITEAKDESHFLIDGKHAVLVDTENGTICVWNWYSGKLMHSSDKFPIEGIMEVKLQGDIIVCQCRDSELSVWNIQNAQLLSTPFKDANRLGLMIVTFEISDPFLITSTPDDKVKLWCLRTGEFIRDLIDLSHTPLTNRFLTWDIVSEIKCTPTKVLCCVMSLRSRSLGNRLLILDFAPQQFT